MIVTKAYKYKLRLTKNQEIRINQWIGSCRYLYNYALQYKQDLYEAARYQLSYYDLKKELPYWKKSDTFLQDVPSQSLQEVIKRVDIAYQNFFRGKGFPKFAKKGMYNSITLYSVRADQKENRLLLPKIGSVKYFNSREITGKIKIATINREPKGYFISIVKETEIPYYQVDENQAAGIDMGVARFCTLSDGDYFKMPDFKKWDKKLRTEQRKLARMKKFGSNWKKQVKKIAGIKAKVARIRNDHQHKVALTIVRKFDLIATENLQVKNMTRSARGNMEKQGKNVRAKNGLNKAILETAPAMFINKLEYKCLWQGKVFIKVDPKFTSLQCSVCGHTEKRNRITQDRFKCVKCGHYENADVNAAKNILARAMASRTKRKASA